MAPHTVSIPPVAAIPLNNPFDQAVQPSSLLVESNAQMLNRATNNNDDDDNDFVCPTRNPASLTRTSPRLVKRKRAHHQAKKCAVAKKPRKQMKASKNAADSSRDLHPDPQPSTLEDYPRESDASQYAQEPHSSGNEEEDTGPNRKTSKGPKLNVRCNPGDVIFTMAMLTSEQLASIAALGFEQLLSMEVDAVESRNLLPWLMDRINPDTMVLRIGPGKVLPINAQVVSIVLGLPNVGTNLCHHSWREGVQAKKDLVKELALEARCPIDIYRLMEELLLGRVDSLSMRCFCLVLFNRLLFPGSSFDISTSDIIKTLDFERFHGVNWAQLCSMTSRKLSASGMAAESRRRHRQFLVVHPWSLYITWTTCTMKNHRRTGFLHRV